MKLKYRTKVFRVLPYDRNDKDKIHVLIFHTSNEVYENYIAFVDKSVYDANTKEPNDPKWVAFRQKKL